MPAVIIIPARLESSRLPRKLLLPAGSSAKPVIQYTYDAASRSSLADAVYVATDSPEIAAAVDDFGGRVIFTASDHPNGTSRVAEAARRLATEGPLRSRLNERSIIVNVQADEPEIDPAAVDTVIRQLANIQAGEIAEPRRPAALIDSRNPHIWTVAAPFPIAHQPPDHQTDPNTVKVVVSAAGRALYFSRSPLAGSMRHVGVYGYTFDCLMRLPPLAATAMLARAESLEQLAWLEAAIPASIGVVVSHGMPPGAGGVNTRGEYEAFCRRVLEREAAEQQQATAA